MTFMTEMAQHWLNAFLHLWIQPFFYIGILLVVLQYRRQVQLERRLFSTKLHSLIGETYKTVLWGLAGGIIASLLMTLLGAFIQPEAIFFVWVITFLLMLIRVRFICLAYTTGILGILQAILSLVPSEAIPSGMTWLTNPLMKLSIPSMLAVVAVLHLVEALLVRVRGSKAATPIFYEGKRGKVVGGFHLQGFWPVPLLMLLPMAGGSVSSIPWAPLFGGEWMQSGWTIAVLPVMLGFTEMTISKLPKEKARVSSNLLMVYSVIVFLAALAAEHWGWMVLVASIVTVGLHEGMVLYSSRQEAQSAPLFVHGPNGLKILAVLPGTPAEELGLQTGEVIQKVNGVRVGSKDELHAALRLNSAFCKLEVLNLQGMTKFAQRALFSGDHHQLGILLAPDDQASYYLSRHEMNVFAYLKRKLAGVERKGTWPSSTSSSQ